MIIELALQAEAGELNALEAFISLKKMEKELEQALEIVQPLAIDEAGKHPERTFKFMGATIEKKNAAGRWDYSQIQAWVNAKNKLKYIEEIAQAGGGYDNETTEQIEKAVKIEGKATISVKLGK